MTKQQRLITRLTRDPITVQQVARLAYYRITLHDAPDSSSGVWIGLDRSAGWPVVDYYEQVFARVSGKVVRLSRRDTDAVISRLRQLFICGGAAPLARRKQSAYRGREGGSSSGGRT